MSHTLCANQYFMFIIMMITPNCYKRFISTTRYPLIQNPGMFKVTPRSNMINCSVIGSKLANIICEIEEFDKNVEIHFLDPPVILSIIMETHIQFSSVI